MQKFVYVALTILTITVAYSCSSYGYVSARPDAVIITRPVAPGPGYVWVDGDYYYRGGRYNYRNGYWAQPRGGRVWNSGGWMQSPRGYYWRRGGWRR